MPKINIYIFLLFVPVLSYPQYTDQINSNRPGQSMGAFAVGKTVIQLETGVYGIAQKHHLLNYVANGYGVDAMLRYGVLREKLELVANIQYQNEVYEALFTKTKHSALKQTVLGAKYLIYDPMHQEKKPNLYSWRANQGFDWSQLIPAVSVFAGANYFTADNPYYFTPEGGFSPKIMLITQNQLGKKKSWGVVSNIVADYIGTLYPSYSYMLTVTKGFNKKWCGFVENQGYKSDFYSDAIIRTGAAFLITNNLQIDASASASLKNTPAIFYGGIGFSWRYDDNYTDIPILKKGAISK